MGITIVVLALGLIFTVWVIRLFNRFVTLRTLKEEGWSGVLTALKRRRDFISNIVKTVMPHESETLRNIAQPQAARSVAETAKAEASITEALAGLRATIENHPDLKEELSELEKRIEKTRRYYNATVRDFNMEMDQFPASLIVGLMGFKRAAFFEADEQPHE